MKNNTKKIVLSVVALVIAVVVMALLYNNFKPKPAKRDNNVTATTVAQETTVADATTVADNSASNETTANTAEATTAETAASNTSVDVTITVVHRNGQAKDFVVTTDALYLRGALEQENLVEGSESAYGLYIEVVDGERADYSVDSSWWGIYLDQNNDNAYDDSEMTMYGCDSQPINANEHYFLVYVAPTVDITVTVVFADQTTKDYSYTTSEFYLGALLTADGLIEGYDSDWGLYVTTVDGIVASDEAHEYWALYVNDEYSMTGFDTTPLNNGDHFTIALETY